MAENPRRLSLIHHNTPYHEATPIPMNPKNNQKIMHTRETVAVLLKLKIGSPLIISMLTAQSRTKFARNNEEPRNRPLGNPSEKSKRARVDINAPPRHVTTMNVMTRV
jgi:hypothetical protein